MQLEEFVLNLPAQLAPIRGVAERLAGPDSRILENCVEYSHRPKIGPDAYALTLFKSQGSAIVEKYQKIHDFRISPQYALLLSAFNGAFAFQLSLFGISASMANETPLLNRSDSQPHDLATANRYWKKAYKVSQDWFHFGGGPLSEEENVGYFLDHMGTIHAARKAGPVVTSWQEFSRFLSDELARCEAMFPHFEKFMVEASQATKNPSLIRRFSSLFKSR